MKQDEIELLAGISQKKNPVNWLKNMELKSSSNSMCVNIATQDILEKNLLCICVNKNADIYNVTKSVYKWALRSNPFYKLSANAKKDKTYDDFCNPTIMHLLNLVHL